MITDAEVYAIGDVHGAHEALIELLTALGLIDSQQRWQGGDRHLVSVGDLIDRGDATRPVLDLWLRLESEAAAAGGGVHVLMGNHELMNLLGEWRDVSAGDLRSFAASSSSDGTTERRAAFAADGRYGRWLRARPWVLQINHSLFVHGGLSATLPVLEAGAIDAGARRALGNVESQAQALRDRGELGVSQSLLDLPAPITDEAATTDPLATLRTALEDPLLSDAGPLWYRGNSRCPALLETPVVEQVLAANDAARIVVGHTPTWNRQIQSRLDGRVWAIDTGMLKAVYGGAPMALRVHRGQVSVFDGRGQPIRVAQDAQPGGADRASALAGAHWRLQADPERALPPALGQAVLLHNAQGEARGRGAFLPLKARAVQRELAALQLDRWLGLGMVPDAFAGSLDGRSGLVRLLDSAVVPERTRLERGYRFDDWCLQGSSYELVAAFDALIGQRQRSADNLAYDRRLTRVRLLDHGKAFDSRSRLPQTAGTSALPTPLRERLRALTPEVLDSLLAELLPARALQALLRRRDALLQRTDDPDVGSAS
ncbi:MAG: metallophosphoesterase [Pseudomonadota bacterium]